jgi:PadR family transcriptional regulator
MKEAKPKGKNELLPGTLEMLILKTLSIEPMHGYGIAQHIQMLSADVLTIEEGSLYPALQRMLVKRWVLAEWKISANNRRVAVVNAPREMPGGATGDWIERGLGVVGQRHRSHRDLQRPANCHR